MVVLSTEKKSMLRKKLLTAVIDMYLIYVKDIIKIKKSKAQKNG